MSSIYDISGTTSDSFSMNGKCTLLQGDEAPQAYQGLDGDVYFQSNGAVYAKRNGTWLNLTGTALPDASTAPGYFIKSNGENYELSDIGGGDNTFTGDNIFEGNNTFTGEVTFTKPINGIAYRAYWADLAEYYETDQVYPCGTLIQFGGKKEITIAKNEVNAVISSKPAFILNESMLNAQPIALCGRVPVRVIGKVNKFDYLGLSDIPGVACAIQNKDTYLHNIIARTLESKNTEEEGLVLCVVKFEI